MIFILKDPQIYWAFGLRPSSSITALSKEPNRVGAFSPHLRTETDLVSETLCFLVSKTPQSVIEDSSF
jgi:hypothetical protein